MLAKHGLSLRAHAPMLRYVQHVPHAVQQKEAAAPAAPQDHHERSLRDGVPRRSHRGAHARHLQLPKPRVERALQDPPSTPGLRSRILRQGQRRVRRRFNRRRHRLRSPDPLRRNNQRMAADTQLTRQASETGRIAPTRNEVHEMRGHSDIPDRHCDRSGQFRSPKLLLPGSERRVGHALPRRARAGVAVAGDKVGRREGF